MNPDFVVTGVTYDSTGSRIESYELRKVTGDTAGDPFKSPWPQVAKAILEGTRFMSATPNGSGGWQLGAEVRVVVKTVEDLTLRDNLTHLRKVA